MMPSEWTVLAAQFAKLPNDITLRCHESVCYRIGVGGSSGAFGVLARRAGEALGGNRDHWLNTLTERFPEAVDYLGECPMPPRGRHTVFYIPDAAGLSRMQAAELAGQADDPAGRPEHNPEDSPRKYVTREEAQRKAEEQYESLWRINNQCEWGRRLGCHRDTVLKVPAWSAAKRRRQSWKKVETRLSGLVDAKIIEALHTSDASVLGSLSEADRDKLDALDDAGRAELIELLTEQARDAIS